MSQSRIAERLAQAIRREKARVESRQRIKREFAEEMRKQEDIRVRNSKNLFKKAEGFIRRMMRERKFREYLSQISANGELVLLDGEGSLYFPGICDESGETINAPWNLIFNLRSGVLRLSQMGDEYYLHGAPPEIQKRIRNVLRRLDDQESAISFFVKRFGIGK